MKIPKSILAIIPARGGSKGIHRKNLAELGGHPLIAWTIFAAKAGLVQGKVIVSTDDAEIADVSKRYGAEVPFLRPAEYSGDAASAVDVIKHALLNCHTEDGQAYEVVAYLQPTSPFRHRGHLADAIKIFREAAPDTLVSVTQVAHNMVPGSIMRPLDHSEGILRLASPNGQGMRRQEKEVLYARNGPAILLVSASDILLHNRLYGETVIGFMMDRLASLDIDEPLDLDMARCLLPLVSGIGVK